MDKVRITKAFSFEMAHALDRHDGLCRNIHGHSYHLWVTVIGEPISEPDSPKNGMVIDFTGLKQIVNNIIIKPLDHALMLYEFSEHLSHIKQMPNQKLVLVSFNPTCEKMVVDFARQINEGLPDGIRLHSLKLQETKTSYAEWFASDN